MPIEGFDYSAFANDLAQQAAQILEQQSNAAPDNLTKNDRDTITDTLKRFCLMAGEALSNDPQITLNAEQASLITQFIGEWTFHKSIDLINGKIPVENREPILQVIAANIFNTAKLAIIKNLPQDKLVTLIETKVGQVYNAELEKLVKQGVLTPEQGSEAANKSNLNDMVQKTQEEQKQKAVDQFIAESSSEDKKSLKFIALAILLKRLSEERKNEILSAFSDDDVKQITAFMRMSDLENKIDSLVILRELKEIKKLIPKPKEISIDVVLKKFHKVVKNAKPEILNKISINERENVRDFVLDNNFPATEVFAPKVLVSVAKTLEDKINDN